MRLLLLTTFILSLHCSAMAKRPYVYAGPDQVIRAGEKAYLQGRASHVKFISWKTTGTGTFSNPLALATVYTPSKADISKGEVTLIIYNRKKPTMRDSLKLTIAGCRNTVNIPLSADTICGFDAGVNYDVSAAITGSSYYTLWTTSGTGSFFDDTSPATTYEASRSDVGSGGVWLKITVYDSLKRCSPVSDSIFLKLNDPARIDIPDGDIQACGSAPVYLDGNISGTATAVYWTTSGTGYFSSDTSGSTYYYPSSEDIAQGYITITGVTNDPAGPCGAASDYVNILFNNVYVNAGSDIVTCGSMWGGPIVVEASSNTSTGITWTTSGTGYFEDPYAFTTTYYYTDTDVNYAFIELYATVYNDGCGTVTDTVVVWLQAEPQLVFPETSVYQCANQPVYANVYLYGYASGGYWTTTGSGTFQDPTSTYTAYYPGADETNACVDLIFTSNDPDGPCVPVSGSMSACFYDCGGGESFRKGVANNADNNLGNAIAVHPNPAKDLLEIKTDTEVNEEATYITDLFGNKVNLHWAGKSVINISELQPGQYFLHVISTEGKLSVVRFIKR